MSTAERSIEVNVGVTTAYDQWTRFDSFPRWMEGVAWVDRIDDTHIHCREWDARITAQIRDTRISWKSVGGKPDEKPDEEHVTFEPLGDSACRVTFRIDWEPEAALKTNESLSLIHI